MPKVTVVQVIYNNKPFIEPVFSAIYNQTFRDFNVVAVISGNEDRGKELLQEKFPQVTIIDPGYNIGFAAGHNLVFAKYDPEFFQLVNPDLVLRPNYIEEMLKAFGDPAVGAATGKLYQIDRAALAHTPDIGARSMLDSTGVVIAKSGRARDRGQHEIDKGQYDALTDIQAVSGAGPMYRASALHAVAMEKNFQFSIFNFQKDTSTPHPSPLTPQFEFFDEDFHSYWEDVDLSWRMGNAGWKNIFVPTAIGYHGRGAGSSKGGYKNILGFIRHHKALSPRVRQLNYKNHIFMYIKNSKWPYPQFFIREFFMFLYILIFEISTLKIFPELFRLIPKMWRKRRQA